MPDQELQEALEVAVLDLLDGSPWGPLDGGRRVRIERRVGMTVRQVMLSFTSLI